MILRIKTILASLFFFMTVIGTINANSSHLGWGNNLGKINYVAKNRALKRFFQEANEGSRVQARENLAAEQVLFNIEEEEYMQEKGYARYIDSRGKKHIFPRKEMDFDPINDEFI